MKEKDGMEEIDKEYMVIDVALLAHSTRGSIGTASRVASVMIEI